MYNLVACSECKHSELIQMPYASEITRVYICFNNKSSEYGLVHAAFYECRLREDERIHDGRK